ncbi:MAG: hypothetical protein JHC81_01810 [Brevundimonas sp.]|uniref:hypothetical protein n=1 Tax=Brevundimonas sp. TaxID=1871086 RepID=UPI001A1F56DB|nr:hypothetical protein [Brevundimonas sp.]MBJ7446243.1 hypothetical protein [Brevundimonas sp.]
MEGLIGRTAADTLLGDHRQSLAAEIVDLTQIGTQGKDLRLRPIALGRPAVRDTPDLPVSVQGGGSGQADLGEPLFQHPHIEGDLGLVESRGAPGRLDVDDREASTTVGQDFSPNEIGDVAVEF